MTFSVHLLLLIGAVYILPDSCFGRVLRGQVIPQSSVGHPLDLTKPTMVDISDLQHMEVRVRNALRNYTGDRFHPLSGDRFVVTVTNHPDKAIDSLRKVSVAPVIILYTGPEWPGDLIRLEAFKITSLVLPASAVILLTDCCDVWFRPMDRSHDIFSRFLHEVSYKATGPLAGKKIVFSADRGFAHLKSGKHTQVPQHNHLPTEFPDNKFQQELGVPDECDASSKLLPRCLQAKFANSGLVIGFARSLFEFYKNVWMQCELCMQWERSDRHLSLESSSDQNEISHSLLMDPKFDDGRCAIDIQMSLFHCTAGYLSADYQRNNDIINLTLPGGHTSVLEAPLIHAPHNRDAIPIMAKIKGNSDLLFQTAAR